MFVRFGVLGRPLHPCSLAVGGHLFGSVCAKTSAGNREGVVDGHELKEDVKAQVRFPLGCARLRAFQALGGSVTVRDSGCFATVCQKRRQRQESVLVPQLRYNRQLFTKIK